MNGQKQDRPRAGKHPADHLFVAVSLSISIGIPQEILEFDTIQSTCFEERRVRKGELTL